MTTNGQGWQIERKRGGTGEATELSRTAARPRPAGSRGREASAPGRIGGALAAEEGPAGKGQGRGAAGRARSRAASPAAGSARGGGHLRGTS